MPLDFLVFVNIYGIISSSFRLTISPVPLSVTGTDYRWSIPCLNANENEKMRLLADLVE
jgi:hypothetical protein